MPLLPEIPRVELDVVAHHQGERSGFLDLKRLELRVRRRELKSSSFHYDVVDRRALDAAVIAAHHVNAGKPYVYLRSSIRPPIALREGAEPHEALLWELPAGLIEPGEAPHVAAARELEEELGFRVGAEAMAALGPVMYPAPAFIAEKHFYFHVRVDDTLRRAPSGDGSPLEEDALIISVSLDDALAACVAGEIRDLKTELALRRLADVLRI